MIKNILAILYEISTYEKGKGKNIIRSKTLWVNILALLSFACSKWAGFELSIEDQTAILAVVNIVLRLISKEETGLIERPPSQANDKGVLGETHNQ